MGGLRAPARTAFRSPKRTGIPGECRPCPRCPIHDGFMSWVGFTRQHEPALRSPKRTGIPGECRPWPGCPIHDGFMSWVGFAPARTAFRSQREPGSPASALTHWVVSHRQSHRRLRSGEIPTSRLALACSQSPTQKTLSSPQTTHPLHSKPNRVCKLVSLHLVQLN